MPRRRPRHLDAVRFEMGTFERQLAKDAIMVQGIKSAALQLAAGILGLGLAAAGFLAYNKVDDLKEWGKGQDKFQKELKELDAEIQRLQMRKSQLQRSA